MSEIARAGLLSVGDGQSEAAAALGMGRGLAMRRIVLPQAMRVIIPPTGNETISMLKTTSLVIVDRRSPTCTGSAQSIYSQATFLQVPLLVVASIWYLVMTQRPVRSASTSSSGASAAAPTADRAASTGAAVAGQDAIRRDAARSRRRAGA